ncbi:MAG: hypothetical protein ABI624_14800 [Casimicrobiaceae bacterium]
MMRLWLLLGLALAMTGCVVYEPMVVQPTAEQRFDRSWSAAGGALADEGVTITAQDRSAGIIRGARGSIGITASVRTLADGRTEVRFDQTGDASGDPNLVHRVSDSSDRRMGR